MYLWIYGEVFSTKKCKMIKFIYIYIYIYSCMDMIDINKFSSPTIFNQNFYHENSIIIITYIVLIFA